MAESNGLLNRHRGNSIGGSNPPLSAIFFCKKNGERRRKSSLHCAKHNFTQNRRFSSLPRRNAMKPGHLHQTPEALLACPAIARRATADEDAPVFALLRRGKPFHSLVKAFHSAAAPLHLLVTA